MQTVWALIGIVEETREYVCWSERGKTFVAHKTGNVITDEELTVQLPTWTGLIDTCCRPPVGGHDFHVLLQVTDSWSCVYRKVKQVAFYQHAPGKPIHSEIVWLYQLGISGHVKELRMAEIPLDCPGLKGLGHIASWRWN